MTESKHTPETKAAIELNATFGIYKKVDGEQQKRVSVNPSEIAKVINKHFSETLRLYKLSLEERARLRTENEQRKGALEIRVSAWNDAEKEVLSLKAEKSELVEFVNNTNISKKEDGLWLSIKGGTKFASILLSPGGPIVGTAIENWQKIRKELIAKLNKE